MKLKTTLTLAALVMSGATLSHGQSLIAGWDFTNGHDTSVNPVSATFSDFGTSDTQAGSSGNGSMTIALASPRYTVSVNNNLTANNAIDYVDSRNALNDTFGTGASMNFQTFGASANGLAFTAMATSNDGTFFDDFFVSLGAGLQNDTSASLTLEYSFDDSSYFALGSAANVTASIASGGESFAFTTGSVTASDTIYVRGTLAGLDSNGHAMSIDNVQIGGAVVVPEPSSFALFAGILAVGFVALRRRG